MKRLAVQHCNSRFQFHAFYFVVKLWQVIYGNISTWRREKQNNELHSSLKKKKIIRSLGPWKIWGTLFPDNAWRANFEIILQVFYNSFIKSEIKTVNLDQGFSNWGRALLGGGRGVVSKIANKNNKMNKTGKRCPLNEDHSLNQCESLLFRERERVVVQHLGFLFVKIN